MTGPVPAHWPPRRFSLTHSLPLDEVSDRVRWPVSESAVDQHPGAPTHSSSPQPPLFSLPEESCWRGSRLTFRQGHQTLLHLSSCFIPHTPPAFPYAHSHTHFPLMLCPSVSALKTEARLRGRQGALYVELC